MKSLVLVAAIAVGLLIPVQAQVGQTFRSATDVVSVYATVTDDTGRLVPDLTKDDFTIYDNGQEVPLAYFSNEVQPFSVVVMLDRSSSMTRYFNLVRDAAGRFVAAMQPDDRARIGSFSNEILMDPATFTSDKDELTGILHDRLQNGGTSPVWAAIDRSVLATSGEQGRRVVLVFTDGEDDVDDNHVPSMPLRDVVQDARAHDVMIYAIGFAYEEDAPPPRKPSSPVWRPRFPVPGGGRFPSRFDLAQFGGHSRRAVKPPDPGLRQLADETGGGYFELTPDDDLKATFTRVAEELHRQYALGFSPTTLDGQLHHLDVRVRRGDLHVRARRSYVAGGGR